jgi:hypothetical protein
MLAKAIQEAYPLSEIEPTSSHSSIKIKLIDFNPKYKPDI